MLTKLKRHFEVGPSADMGVPKKPFPQGHNLTGARPQVMCPMIVRRHLIYIWFSIRFCSSLRQIWSKAVFPTEEAETIDRVELFVKANTANR